MASVSASHLILFIASILVAASVSGVLTSTVGDLSNAIDDTGLQVSDDVRTDIEIISDSGSDAVYNDTEGNITLYVKNTGSLQLAADSNTMDVLVNGQYETDVTVTLLEDSVTWDSGDVVRLDISRSLATNEDHRIQLTVNGDEEVFQFNT
ncbi:flagellar protein G [Halapricum salinum]|uniref:Flagellar protein G n=1 Tax=Halapricum salinum TaxID=1457250 RepID=A0A4D6HAT6_9EURY|nr:flagellar protein G [Halapricum salinum]QCC50621.1 flagellar protein G [Halapricum salinum]